MNRRSTLSCTKFASFALTGLALAGCICEFPVGESVKALPDGEPGLFTISVDHDGDVREAVVYVPSTAIGTEAPVVLNFHGYGGQAAWHMEDADMRSLADQEGFVLVYPQGSALGADPHWNAAPAGGDNKSTADDIGYTDAVLEAVSLAHTVDPERVYAVGYSNGAMFAYYLACAAGDRIAAVGAVSGTMLDGTCPDGDPISVISIHGTGDSVLPYDGDGDLLSAEDIVDYWRARNGTTDTASHTETVGGVRVESSMYTGGEGGTEVEHHRVIGGGHVWFEEATVGTNDKLWAFLSRFDRSGAL